MTQHDRRADPFDFDLSGFKPAPAKSQIRPEAIREVSEVNNFPSRSPSPRRRRTGRNVQLNIKVTPQTIERFAAISDRNRWTFGETLERALDALMQIGQHN